MRILLLNWMDLNNPQSGGAEVHLFEIFSRFVDRGDDVTLISSGFNGGKPFEEIQGIKVYRTGTRETFNFAVPRKALELERKNNFDLVVEDINKVPLFSPLYLRKPIIAVIPHLFGGSVFRETNPLFASYVYLMEKPIPLVYIRAVFEVISESTAKDLERRGISPSMIRIVHCGMDHSVFNHNPSVKKFETPTVLYAGRIKRYKSVDVLIMAFPEVLRRVPGAKLAVVGTGDNLDELKKLTVKLGISDNVTFTGFVSEEEKVDWMRKSHVIVNPSPREGWGLTNIEANACGTTAVASDADGLRDSVRDNVTGMLFPYGDHKTLADKLVLILTDARLREKLEKNALDWASKFTWDETAEMTMKIADSVVMV